MSTNQYNLVSDYSKGSLSSFIPTDINQGWVIDPKLLIRNLDYISSTLSISSTELENEFYTLIQKIFSDKDYLQAIQFEFLKYPVGTITTENIDSYVENIYQSIILYAVIDKFYPSILSNTNIELENKFLDVLNLVINSDFQTNLDTAFQTMDFSGLDLATLENYVNDIYTQLGSTTIPRAKTFDITEDLKNMSASPTNDILTYFTSFGSPKLVDFYKYLVVQDPTDYLNIKLSFEFDNNVYTTSSYNPNDWSNLSSSNTTFTDSFNLYTDANGNNTGAGAGALTLLPGTQIGMSKRFPASNIYLLESNRISDHNDVILTGIFTDNNYVNDTVMDTDGQILGKRTFKVKIKYIAPANYSSMGYYGTIPIPLDSIPKPIDGIISIPLITKYNPSTESITILNSNALNTNLTAIGSYTVKTYVNGITLEIPVPIDRVFDPLKEFAGKYLEFEYKIINKTTGVASSINKITYNFISKVYPVTAKSVALENNGNTIYQAKVDDLFYDTTALSRLSSLFTFEDELDKQHIQYIFTINKSLSDPSWTLSYLNGVYTFDCPKATIKIRKCLSISNEYEFYHVLKGLTTLDEYKYTTGIQTLPLVIDITGTLKNKYIDDNTFDTTGQIYGKRTRKFEPVTHYTGDYTNVFQAPSNISINLNTAFTGFILPDGEAGTAIHYITAQYLFDPTMKNNINVSVTEVSNTLPSTMPMKQVVQYAIDRIYFQSLATSLDRSTLNNDTVTLLDQGKLSELGAIYNGKEIKINIKITKKDTGDVLLDKIQTILFQAY